VRQAFLVALLCGAVLMPAQQKQPPDKKPPESKPQQQQQEQEPPEEDETLKPREYSFNPLEAQKDLQVGNYYFKKGNYKGALNRFREATLWNPTFAEAFLRLGDTEEKMKDRQAARDAYSKYLELAPDGKSADLVRKKLAGQR